MYPYDGDKYSIEEVLQLFLLKESYDYFDILEFIIK